MTAGLTCNASLIIPDTDKKPYPLRFVCIIYSGSVRIDIPSEYDYNSAYGTYSLYLYVAAFINESQTVTSTESGWKVYALAK